MAETNPYADRREHRFHDIRRRLKKTVQLFGLIGLVSLVRAVVFRLYGLRLSHRASRDRMLAMAATDAGGGAFCLLVRWPLAAFREKRFRHRRRSDGREGMALVLVLLLLALVSALVLEAQLSAQQALRREERALLRVRLELAAADAACAALQRLADDPDLEADHTNEAWAATTEITDPAGLTVWTWVRDENRFWDLNNLMPAGPPSPRPAPEVMMDLMTLCGDFEPVPRTHALLDWLDDNAEGAWESDYYRKLPIPYEAANRLLFSLSEILSVRGFRRELFARKLRYAARADFQADLVDQVTVLPIERRAPVAVNLNTASPEVLRAVFGINQDDLVRVLLVRRARAPLQSVNTILDLVDQPLRDALRPYLAVRSRFFCVETRADAQGQTVRLRALAERQDDGKVAILQWVSGGGGG